MEKKFVIQVQDMVGDWSDVCVSYKTGFFSDCWGNERVSLKPVVFVADDAHLALNRFYKYCNTNYHDLAKRCGYCEDFHYRAVEVSK